MLQKSSTQVWCFEESGESTPDYSGHNSTITWNGTPSRGTDNGRHGGGVRLTGSQWGEATTNTLVGGQVAAEARLWFDALSNTSFPNNQAWMGIVTKYGSSGGNRWRLTLSDGGRLKADMNVTSGGTEYYKVASYDTPVQTGRWYHVALTYDGNRIRLWADGIEVASAGRCGYINDNGQAIWIGRNQPNDPTLIGRIDGVRVPNVARTALPHGSITSPPSAAAGRR